MAPNKRLWFASLWPLRLLEKQSARYDREALKSPIVFSLGKLYGIPLSLCAWFARISQLPSGLHTRQDHCHADRTDRKNFLSIQGLVLHWGAALKFLVLGILQPLKASAAAQFSQNLHMLLRRKQWQLPGRLSVCVHRWGRRPGSKESQVDSYTWAGDAVHKFSLVARRTSDG